MTVVATRISEELVPLCKTARCQNSEDTFYISGDYKAKTTTREET